jgi:hypothetical protein
MWTATATARRVGLILRDRRCGIRLTSKPAGVHALDGVRESRSCLGWGAGLRLRVRLRQVAGLHHEKAQGLLRHPPITGLALYGAEPAVAMPLAARFVLGPPRFCHEEGQGWVLRPPRVECLAHRPGAWHEGHHAHTLFPTQA